MKTINGLRQGFSLAFLVSIPLLLLACTSTKEVTVVVTATPPPPSDVIARSVVFSTDVGPTATRNVVSSTASEIRVQIGLEGVQPGMIVTARWYQLGVADVPPEGQEISSGQVALTAESISSEGESIASFLLSSGPSGFPRDSWLLRIYVDDELVRTAGLVVSDNP